MFKNLEQTALENVKIEVAWLYGTKFFDKFPLFDETLRHIELCNSVTSQIQQNPQKMNNSVSYIR